MSSSSQPRWPHSQARRRARMRAAGEALASWMTSSSTLAPRIMTECMTAWARGGGFAEGLTVLVAEEVGAQPAAQGTFAAAGVAGGVGVAAGGEQSFDGAVLLRRQLGLVDDGDVDVGLAQSATHGENSP